MAGILTRFKKFMIGKDEIEIYGGSKGGYHYVIFYDPMAKEVMSQYVSPPKQETKNLGGSLGVHGVAGIEVNYQSEETLGEPFVIMNRDAKIQIKTEEITAKIKEQKIAEIPSTAIKTHTLEQDKFFIAGSYVSPVAQKDIENPQFAAHFGTLSTSVGAALSIFPEFVVKNFWPMSDNQRIFRSCIFLPDAIRREHKMRASYNMTQYVDHDIAIPFGSGVVSEAFDEKKTVLVDFNIVKHHEYKIDPAKVWDGMKSILSIPILDSSNIPLGVLSVDTNLRYSDADFDATSLNGMLLMLSRGIGRLLEGHM